MPMNYEELERRAGMFNERYGVNFSITEFVNSMNALNDDFVDIVRDKNEVNTFYRVAFSPLVKKALENYVDNKIVSFDPWQMLREFEANVMSFYRSECERTKEGIPPDVDAGWTQNEYFQRVNRDLQGMNPDKQIYTSEKYMSGQLRLRDMRKYIENTGELVSAGEAATVMVYARAVNEAIEKRTALWRFFHPFKSRAEVRDLEVFKKFLKENTGSDELSIDLNKYPHLKYVKAELEKEPIAEVKAALANALDNPVPSKPEREYLYEKPNVNMTDMSEKARINPNDKKPMEMHDFLKVGYRPDLANIAHEYETATPLYNAVVKNGQKLSDDPKVHEAASVILMKNYMRVNLFKHKVDAENGNLVEAEKLLKACEPNYIFDDQSFINQYPKYVPPEIPADIVKEKIEVPMEENVSDLSQKIDFDVRQINEKKLGQ